MKKKGVSDARTIHGQPSRPWQMPADQSSNFIVTFLFLFSSPPPPRFSFPFTDLVLYPPPPSHIWFLVLFFFWLFSSSHPPSSSSFSLPPFRIWFKEFVSLLPLLVFYFKALEEFLLLLFFSSFFFHVHLFISSLFLFSCLVFLARLDGSINASFGTKSQWN